MLEEIYRAVSDQDAFDRLPAILAEACGARSAIIFQTSTARPELAEVSYSYFDSALIQRFVHDETWREHDIWTPIAAKNAQDGHVISLEPFVDGDAFKSTVIYNDLIRVHGDDTTYCMGTTFTSGSTFHGIGLHRGDRQGGFTNDETRRLQSLIPHIRHAYSLRALLRIEAARADAAEAVCNAYPLAVLRLRHDASVSFANAAASEIIQRGTGFRVNHGRLYATDSRCHRAFKEAIASAAGPGDRRGSGLVVVGLSAHDIFHVSVSPLDDIDASVLVIIAPPRVNERSRVSLFSEMFGFTGAEVTVASALLEGFTPEEIAHLRGVQLPTVRTQVRAICAKLNRRRLTDAVLELSRVSAMTPTR